MSYINNLNLKVKILLVVILPICGFFILSGTNLLTDYRQLSSYTSVCDLSLLSNNISNLVHELQKERGASAGFLGSKGKKFREKLAAQRRDTDSKWEVLESFLRGFDLARFDSELKNKIDEALNLIARIEDKRAGISDQQLTVKDAVTYYTSCNTALLNVIGFMTHLTDNAALTSQIGAYYNFLQSKERAGKERAVLSGVFSRGSFSPGMYALFIQLVTEQNTFLTVFETLATPAERQYVKDTVNGLAVEQVDKMRRVAFEVNLDNTKEFGVDSVVWFDTITNKINLLKKVEDYLSAGLQKSAKTLAVAKKKAIIISCILFAVVLLFCGFMIISVTSSILNGIKQATVVAQELAAGKGDLTKRMNLKSRDEIGILGRAIDRMLDNLSSMVGQIQDISVSLDATNNDLSDISGEMNDQTTDVSGRSSMVAAAADEMKVNMETVALAVKDASDNVTSVARATDEIAAISEEISSNTEKALDITTRAVGQASDSSKRINELGQAADQIGKVTETITEISEQTNLLALNATIEAARAGEAGKGFAVVANEIKDLAKQTATATQEIKSRIEGIQTSTRGTVSEIAEISQVINEIDQIVTGISRSVDTQTSTTTEIAGNINHASQGIEDVTENVSQASAVAKDVARDIAMVDQSSSNMVASTGKVNTVADSLSKYAGRLGGLVEKYKV